MSSKSTFSLVFYINRTKAKKNGECPVMLRITINGDAVALRLKRFIEPNQWDPVRYQMKSRTTVAKVFNDYLDAVRVRAHQKYNDLLMLKEEVLATDLRDAILGINNAKATMIIEVWDDYIASLKSLMARRPPILPTKRTPPLATTSRVFSSRTTGQTMCPSKRWIIT